MKTLLIITLTVVCACSCAVAQLPTTGPASEALPADGSLVASAPASQPVVSIPDLAKGPVDPYNAGEERMKFFKACGTQNELTEESFFADIKRDGGFVRKFDHWKDMLAFDKNANNKIDWFEADAYRQDLRKKILARFDADKDDKLIGQERQAANEFLLSGQSLFAAVRGGANPGAIGRGDQLPPELLEKYDTNGDGELSEQEMQAMLKDQREARQKEMLARYDTNGDGKLDDQERQAMANDQRREGQVLQANMKELAAMLFETDANGELTENGKAQQKEFNAALAGVRQQWELAIFDLDGDGKISPEERQQVQKDQLMLGLKAMVRAKKYMDLDGDGIVTPEERQLAAERFAIGMKQWAGDFILRYDRNGDGKLLDKAERDALIEGMQDDFAARKKKFDADGDGHLSSDELLNLMEDFAKECGMEPAGVVDKQTQTTMPADPGYGQGRGGR